MIGGLVLLGLGLLLVSSGSGGSRRTPRARLDADLVRWWRAHHPEERDQTRARELAMNHLLSEIDGSSSEQLETAATRAARDGYPAIAQFLRDAVMTRGGSR